MTLTAAQVGGNVTGRLDATGCDIGLYVDATHPGRVAMADIYGAEYFGVADNWQQGLTVSRSSIHQIGDSPPDGSQHGVGVYYVRDSGSTGTIENNTICDYQKVGIVVNGFRLVSIDHPQHRHR